VGLPFVRDPVPLFILFRALGFQSDQEICKLIYPDLEGSEAKLFLPLLQPSILQAWPFFNTFTCVQYIKCLTKGYSEAHVLDIIRNQMFVHMPNDPMSQALMLAECVRSVLRVNQGFENQTDRDDIRNQRCLTSGFLIQMLFSNCYANWIKASRLAIDKEWFYNKQAYTGTDFRRIFEPSKSATIFPIHLLTESIMRGFKGKWDSGLGEEKTGVIQSLSRLSYCDFMSHCRRVVLDFDTGKKAQGPRRLHGSQYGYFCTMETPGGASIGIAKNMSSLTAFSLGTLIDEFLVWLQTKGGMLKSENLLEDQRLRYVPVFLNGGIAGYTKQPLSLYAVLKAFKRTGCLPYSTSISFSYTHRRLQIYMDAGRPLRPLIWLGSGQLDKLGRKADWRTLVLGTLPLTAAHTLRTILFVDPLADRLQATHENYIAHLNDHTSTLEYIDPYEQNESFIANFQPDIKPETTHLEIHPSTILSFMTAMIPFCNHNQSLRNQLGDSQSKQAISLYATNWKNRFDNNAHVLCYGESQLTGTLYSNYLGEGRMPYGQNIILAIAPSGYNQDDGIVFNADAFERGLFRTIAYRSYMVREEDDVLAKTKVRIGNPANISSWKDLKPGIDYSKLDERGIIKEGTFCDENTVLVGAYIVNEVGIKTDKSLRPQVWTKGRVEKVVVLINNAGLMTIKVRLVQDRIPELGDKFSNRHGQKGTVGATLRGHDMPRTKDGIVPDMLMNPHAIPSRMTIAQNIEQLFGKAMASVGSRGDGTVFMNDGSPEEAIGKVLEGLGFEKYGNELLYNGMTGEQTKAAIFMGPVYGMRLKHMVEDKWQARGQGRKEQMTHQPTGGRGNQGGLKIGEMDRDSIIGHSMTEFVQESYMKRSDGTVMPICTSCGTMPIQNKKLHISQCPLCDGPSVFIGDSASNLELLPPLHRQKGRIVDVELPYATKVLMQEMASIMNIGLRLITTADTQMLRPFKPLDPGVPIRRVLEGRKLPEAIVQEQIEEQADVTQQIPLDALQAMGVESARVASAAAAAAAEDQPIPDEEAATEVTGDQQVILVNQGAEPVVLLEPPVEVLQQPSLLRRSANARNVVIQPPVIEEVPLGAPARLFPSPIPGAPPTIAVAAPAPSIINVDTSPTAMAAEGLLAQPQNVRRATVGNFTVQRSEPTAAASQFSAPIIVRKLE
jgi:DNA-directed RNA polymerase II subunit RPB2